MHGVQYNSERNPLAGRGFTLHDVSVLDSARLFCRRIVPALADLLLFLCFDIMRTCGNKPENI